MTNETPAATPQSVPGGFLWGATTAGIKASGNPDLAVAVASTGTIGAAMFTSNRVVAAPVIIGRRHLASTGGRVGAVLVNSGNANCATGEQGIEACVSTCVAVAESFGCIFDEVIPSSTGIIGVPFPAEKVLAAIPALKSSAGSTPEHAAAFARAIMTTDTRVKMAEASFTAATDHSPPSTIRIWGAAKGAGMIGPKLDLPPGPPHATMLVYLFTDIAAEPAALRDALAAAVQPSFNSISIDGDTSTNDTVLLLASGASGISLTRELTPAFDAALADVCHSLAYQIVADGEGVTHVVTLDVRGAATDADARLVARAVAHSPLCKTAWSSADPNWGRLIAAAGYSGADFDPNRTRIWVGGQPVFEYGGRALDFNESAAHAAMSAHDFTITIDLGAGEATTQFLTCDLTAEYVRINADYST
ncbi:MAG TPA: bifunctional glutamate N-acetyltransferase/amino-acid acetyltransferase ArgJ [Acidobacteriaceae bacterium]|jgi:glutamate N-acetyltransferase/amino-acid N-acetyltransferase|nr:bifunctional glutamate N-acetyltransferase/amino-acid acetyltransferase ArgJ [Acidobacteriaceae bacterium]